MMFDRN
jgi:hypothetical protein